MFLLDNNKEIMAAVVLCGSCSELRVLNLLASPFLYQTLNKCHCKVVLPWTSYDGKLKEVPFVKSLCQISLSTKLLSDYTSISPFHWDPVQLSLRHFCWICFSFWTSCFWHGSLCKQVHILKRNSTSVLFQCAEVKCHLSHWPSMQEGSEKTMNAAEREVILLQICVTHTNMFTRTPQ